MAAMVSGTNFDFHASSGGRERLNFYKFNKASALPANNDTLDTGFQQIKNVQFCWKDAAVAPASDDMAFVESTVNGQTRLTITVAGTARQFDLAVWGS